MLNFKKCIQQCLISRKKLLHCKKNLTKSWNFFRLHYLKRQKTAHITLLRVSSFFQRLVHMKSGTKNKLLFSWLFCKNLDLFHMKTNGPCNAGNDLLIFCFWSRVLCVIRANHSTFHVFFRKTSPGAHLELSQV